MLAFVTWTRRQGVCSFAGSAWGQWVPSPPPTEAPGAASVQTSVEIKPSSKWQDHCWNGLKGRWSFFRNNLGKGTWFWSLAYFWISQIYRDSNKITIYASWCVHIDHRVDCHMCESTLRNSVECHKTKSKLRALRLLSGRQSGWWWWQCMGLQVPLSFVYFCWRVLCGWVLGPSQSF